ncbi:MAG: type II toxin-antitoxin system ParD family antitoxin [Candidatus Micrarchaeia archaeon]
MTMVNFDLGGDLETYVLARIKKGYATSKAEVIRASLLMAKQTEEDKLAVKKMQALDAEIESGKVKPLTAKEAMGEKYAKMLED